MKSSQEDGQDDSVLSEQSQSKQKREDDGIVQPVHPSISNATVASSLQGLKSSQENDQDDPLQNSSENSFCDAPDETPLSNKINLKSTIEEESPKTTREQQQKSPENRSKTILWSMLFFAIIFLLYILFNVSWHHPVGCDDTSECPSEVGVLTKSRARILSEEYDPTTTKQAIEFSRQHSYSFPSQLRTRVEEETVQEAADMKPARVLIPDSGKNGKYSFSAETQSNTFPMAGMVVDDHNHVLNQISNVSTNMVKHQNHKTSGLESAPLNDAAGDEKRNVLDRPVQANKVDYPKREQGGILEDTGKI